MSDGRRIVPALTAALTCVALLAGGTSAQAVGSPERAAERAASPREGSDAGRPSPPSDEPPGRLLRRTMPGPTAARQLGVRGLRRAAAANDMAAARLERILEDRTARVTPTGRLFYADDPAQAPVDNADESVPATATAALDQTFDLHSRPGSQRTIYLDFDGDSVTGTMWNAYEGGLPSTSVSAFSLDGDRSSFNTDERRLIQDIWARVAEDFAPFDVDVTTAPPAAGALTRTSSSDQTYGTSVLFAPGSFVVNTLCGGSCAGVAWVGTFDRPGSTPPGPAWVFTDKVSTTGWQLTEVASHEAGHTLDLEHDGINTSDYYSGRSPWGPIMGSSRYGLTQWSNGDYAGATQQQDDLATISSSGAPALKDDHGDTPVTALRTVSPGGSATGLISDRHDQDVLRLDHGACDIGVSVATASPGTNLDARLRILNASGSVLAAANPAVVQTSSGGVNGTGASVTLARQSAGTVYVEVDGVGQGGMPSAGYSDYGSVGRYTVSVTGCSGAGGSSPDPGGSGPGSLTGGDAAPPSRVLDLGAFPGRRGGRVTAKVVWGAPDSDGGTEITGYRVTALKVRRNNSVIRRITRTRPASARRWQPRLQRGLYRFQVAAVNEVGIGPASARSNRVRAR